MAKKGILTSMSAVEKRFVRKFQETCLQKEGIARGKWRELKTDALERFRRVQDQRAAIMADEAVEDFTEMICPLYKEKIAARNAKK